MLACTDFVSQARQDYNPAHNLAFRPLPKNLDLTPQAQPCRENTQCVVVRGLPGQTRRDLCCPTCTQQVAALTKNTAKKLEGWRQSLRCQDLLCPVLGECTESLPIQEAQCVLGQCALTSSASTP